jgi:RNA polymerase primary sigma factor
MAENTNTSLLTMLRTTVRPKNDQLSLGASGLLTGAQELELARGIESAHADAWEVALRTRKTVEPVLELAAGELEVGKRDFAPLRRAHTMARTSGNKSALQAVVRAARKAALHLVPLDQDHRCLDLAIARVEELTSVGSPQVRAMREATDRARKLRELFVQANLRLVFYVAAKYRSFGVPLPDLIQEGNMGLMKAVDRFDYRRGLRFSTYASYWIRQMITRAIANDSRTVRVPVHVQDAYQRIVNARRKIVAQEGRKPTLAELAEVTEMSLGRVEATLLSVQGRSISLDDNPFEDSEQTFLDRFVEPDAEPNTPFTQLLAQSEAQEVRHSMRILSQRERDVLCKRFAIGGERHWTLQEIADGYSVTRERIRQIEKGALSKLRRFIEHTA